MRKSYVGGGPSANRRSFSVSSHAWGVDSIIKIQIFIDAKL